MSYQGHTALVLEDNETGRFVLRAILEHHGFAVLESATAPEAIRQSREYPTPIHLLIADVVLRSVGGMEVIRQLKQQRPELACLFVSGYPLDQLLNRGLIESEFFSASGAAFLQKPFAASTLMRVVDRLLNSSGSPASGE